MAALIEGLYRVALRGLDADSSVGHLRLAKFLVLVAAFLGATEILSAPVMTWVVGRPEFGVLELAIGLAHWAALPLLRWTKCESSARIWSGYTISS
jgi:hypothetical protein